MLSSKPSARPILDQLKEYVPGKSMDEIRLRHGLQKVVKLASNENPLGPSPLAMQAYNFRSVDLHLYPQGHAPELLAALSSHLGVDTSNLVIGNGSDEVLAFLAMAFLEPGDRVLSSTPTFSLYETVTQIMGAQYTAIPHANWVFDLEAIAQAVDNRTKIIFLCNPNNPTGTWFSQESLDRLLSGIPTSTLVVVDQAYIEFADSKQVPDLVSMAVQDPRLVLCRTFSKVWGLAGLRVGYGVGHADTVGKLWKVKPPFNVNLPAQFACTAALSDIAHLRQSQEIARLGRTMLTDGLQARGYMVLPSQANFIAAKLGAKAPQIVSWLESQGMIIRGLTGFGMPEWVRISTGTSSENALLLDLLDSWKTIED